MQKKRGGNNWIGIVIFLAIVIGPNLASFLSGAIFQATGMRVGSDLIMGGIIIFAVVASLLTSALRGAGRMNSGSETKLPTTPSAPQQMGAPPRPSSLPPATGGSGTAQMKQPGTPQFEPIINPRVLSFGVAGLVIFGVIFLGILALFGAI
ncbi:hypothetical protein K2Z83_22605 [Oscillochloris sp. ZM17-4]|uniref:hypothetical protein n=1 Tax=Oscillochloris sp. ZM17-4 TaxID=2866714 RepID=UPI001C7382C2|nr:hypothetical protein [Oscillochloris sp. ZM17-4]MBX0330453.1 hypothetical protein [Oscillochloris sp. ZM17-4]